MCDLRATALHDFRFLARIVGGPARPVSLGPARPDEGDDLLCLQDLRVPYEGDHAPLSLGPARPNEGDSLLCL